MITFKLPETQEELSERIDYLKSILEGFDLALSRAELHPHLKAGCIFRGGGKSDPYDCCEKQYEARASIPLSLVLPYLRAQREELAATLKAAEADLAA